MTHKLVASRVIASFYGREMRIVDRNKTLTGRRRMLAWLSAGLVVSAAAILAASFPAHAAQNSSGSVKDTTPNLKTFVGTWKATYNGEVFAVLVLREERGGLAGTLNNFDISVDKDGNLTGGTHKDSGEAPLLNTRFKSGALVFVVMQKDQYAPSTEWKFIPKSADEGELTPLLEHQVNAPKDMIVKPIRMVRDRAKP